MSLFEEPDAGKLQVRFCEGPGFNGCMVEIMWHRRETRRKLRKQTLTCGIGRNRSTRLNLLELGHFGPAGRLVFARVVTQLLSDRRPVMLTLLPNRPVRLVDGSQLRLDHIDQRPAALLPRQSLGIGLGYSAARWDVDDLAALRLIKPPLNFECHEEMRDKIKSVQNVVQWTADSKTCRTVSNTGATR